jgi:peptidoglycan/xylan/chitin deacetylase (PgdA/CDA1 family)
MELGAHSQTHADLLLVDGRDLAYELRESKAAVERITGRPCRTLAYPYGNRDERVVEAAAEAGYELAFAWLPGPWRQLEAPRLPAPPRHGALRLALKLAGVRRRGP